MFVIILMLLHNNIMETGHALPLQPFSIKIYNPVIRNS
jgi:hypothetical protein